MRHPPQRPQVPKPTPPRAWFVVIVTALAALVLIGQKSLHDDQRTPLKSSGGVFAEHPNYGFVLGDGAPGGDPVTQRGFVGSREWPAPRTEGQVRIMVLGDSNSVRLGAVDWPEALEARLRSEFPTRDIWVQNFAVPGHSSWHALEIAKGEAATFDPDIVILNIGTNDPYPAGASDAETRGRPYAVDGGLVPRVSAADMASNMRGIAALVADLPRHPFFVQTIAHWPRESDGGAAALEDTTVEERRTTALEAITFPADRMAIVDFEALTLATGKRKSFLMSMDTIHLNDAGQKLLTERYFEVLRPLIGGPAAHTIP